MSDKLKRIILFLVISFLFIGALYLFFDGLALAKGVLAPIFLAIILAMMLAPASNWLEKKGLNRGWASFLSDLLFVLFIVGVLWAVGMEVQKLAGQGSSIQNRLSSQFQQVESFVEKNSGFSLENPFKSGQQEGNQQSPTGGESSGNQQQANQGSTQSEGNSGLAEQQDDQQAKQGGGMLGGGKGLSIKNILTTVASKIFSSLTTILLISVYIFFMLLYRKKFRRAVLKYIPEDKQQEGKRILSEIIKDARQYLIGNLILVALLTVVYSIGFSISGMQSPFTTAFLAALLSLIPYVGNIIAGAISLALAFVTTGKMSAVWIVLATFAVAQFIESYFIEPYLVGKRVKVNPLFSIIAVIIGAAVWGVIGMIVFLPLFGFIKVVADHVPILKPLGYTIGTEDESA